MESLNIDNALKDVGLLLLFINALLFTFSYLKSKHKNKALMYFVIYLTFTFCVLLASIVIVDIQRKFNFELNNLFLSHFYFIFQFVFLSLFYRELFTIKQKYWVNSTIVLVALILSIQYFLNWSLFKKFNLLEILITSFPLVVYSIIHLYNSLGKPGKHMYINAAILIYLSVSTLIFILGNLIIVTVDRSISNNVWLLNKVFYVGYLILILIEWRKSLWRTEN